MRIDDAQNGPKGRRGVEVSPTATPKNKESAKTDSNGSRPMERKTEKFEREQKDG